MYLYEFSPRSFHPVICSINYNYNCILIVNNITKLLFKLISYLNSFNWFSNIVFQEEFAQLFKQLEALRDKNLRLGNRQLADKIAAMQEVSKRGVWSTNVDKKLVSVESGNDTVGYASFANSRHGYGHSMVGSQKSLVVNQNGKKPFMKEVTV